MRYFLWEGGGGSVDTSHPDTVAALLLQGVGDAREVQREEYDEAMLEYARQNCVGPLRSNRELREDRV